MEIILLKKVRSLGQTGDVVKVRDGYMRNYLAPNHLALVATEENKKIFEEQKTQIEAQDLQLKSEAEALLPAITNCQVMILRSSSEAGQLYGSVRAKDIVEALQAQNITISSSQVIINQPFKEVGVYKVKLYLHEEISTTIFLNIANDEDSAAKQMETYLNDLNSDSAPASN